MTSYKPLSCSLVLHHTIEASSVGLPFDNIHLSQGSTAIQQVYQEFKGHFQPFGFKSANEWQLNATLLRMGFILPVRFCNLILSVVTIRVSYNITSILSEVVLNCFKKA